MAFLEPSRYCSQFCCDGDIITAECGVCGLLDWGGTRSGDGLSIENCCETCPTCARWAGCICITDTGPSGVDIRVARASGAQFDFACGWPPANICHVMPLSAVCLCCCRGVVSCGCGLGTGPCPGPAGTCTGRPSPCKFIGCRSSSPTSGPLLWHGPESLTRACSSQELFASLLSQS